MRKTLEQVKYEVKNIYLEFISSLELSFLCA